MHFILFIFNIFILKLEVKYQIRLKVGIIDIVFLFKKFNRFKSYNLKWIFNEFSLEI